MSDFILDPDEAEQSALTLFEVADDLHEDFRLVTSAASGLQASVDTGEFPGIAEVVEAVEHWDEATVPKLRARVEEIAQFMAVYTKGHLELDEFNAEMFFQTADADLFPVDNAARRTPVPEPPVPPSGPTYYTTDDGTMQFTE